MKKCGACQYFVKWKNDKISDFCERHDIRTTSDSKACNKFEGLSRAGRIRNKNRQGDWGLRGLDEACQG